MDTYLIEVIQAFIDEIDAGNHDAIIIVDKDGDYHCQTGKENAFDGDVTVYTYAMYVNSSDNLTTESIGKKVLAQK